MRRLLRYVLLALSAQAILGIAQYQHGESGDGGSNSTETVLSSSESSPSSTATPISTIRTCSSRTVNYITHTLPQKCLRTDRAATDPNKSARADDDLSNVSTRASTESVNSPSSTDDAASLTSTSDVSTSASETALEADSETDSPLDNANFLSFEEWKRQNQAKLEQGQPVYHGDRQRPGINNALDTLGDEGEIELDFSGFGSGADGPRQQQAAYKTANGATSDHSAPTSNAPRSKDAGKTCKERTNYASFDCAATVLKTNPECKSASSTLVENKDSYMLNICSANNKFFIVELCNNILIDTVVLANYEFFSSIFRHFRVSASERYPVKLEEWVDLGTFEARNTREVQAFLIKHPQIWARYVRIEFISHYGSEYYCPVSLLRIHGTTMLEDVWLQQQNVQGENAEDEVTLEAEATAAPTISQEPVSSTDEAEKATLQAMPPVDETSKDAPSVDTGHDVPKNTSPNSDVELTDPPIVWTVNVTGILTSVAIPVPTEMTCASNMTTRDDSASSKTEPILSTSNEVWEPQKESVPTGDPPSVRNSGSQITKASGTHAKALVTRMSSDEVSDILTGSAAADITSTSRSATGSSSPSPHKVEGNTKHNESTTMTSPTSTNTPRTVSSTVSNPPQPQPSTQESFFKSIHKRLQQLEANSTLSLQYIEEQSRILRDAFSLVSKRQLGTTTTFLTSLNTTVMSELHSFRQAYDQLWQSTVIELDGQREQYQREMRALSSRLTLVADELVWQKRMGIVQSTLLLLCLAFVLFARSGAQAEMPLVQQVMSRSQAALRRRAQQQEQRQQQQQGWESPVDSPSPLSRSPVRLLKRKLQWRAHTMPESIGTDSRPESKDGPSEVEGIVDGGGGVELLMPTPRSESPTGRGGHAHDVVEDVVDTREVRSSPPTPTGTRESEPLDFMSGGGDFG